ncbi:MAG TPA: DUF5916 domain-containing protein [Vicinamibacterales bacterium]|nr:DUF5916 domain-containing protein [Vicinamibacterales bacterium]
MHRAVILSLIVCALGAHPAAAQTGDPIPELAAERLHDDERIELDGVLDEPVWLRAVPATDFRQQEPIEGAPPSERTEVRVAFSANSLYIGAHLFDSDPAGIKGFQQRRDAGLGSDDRFMWILDTFRDGRTAYFFEINPAGLLGDGLLRIGSGRNLSKSWDGIWDVRVSRHERGWTAEIRIPFRTLNFDPGSDLWGINFQRTIRRRNEELIWSGYRRNQGLFLPINAGVLTGLRDISQGLGLEAKPYVAGNWFTDDGVTRTGRDIGLDLGYSVTPSLRLAMTINTDFAETEVDDRQVNLTRFPLFFPERRQFFLEGSSIYNFAGSSGVTPFFSRRIGLVGGEPIPVQFGARLGGQAGAWDVGLLQVRTGAHGEVPAEDFSVARLRRNFFAQSSVGAIYTRRDTALTGVIDLPDRHTYGIDLDLSTSTVLGNKNLQFEAFVAAHTESARDDGTILGDRSVRGFRLNYPNEEWQAHVSFREFGDAWDPAVGFAPRRGFRRLQPTVSWNPRPGRLAHVRELQFQLFLEHLTDLDGVLETRRVSARPLGIRLNQGDGFEVEVANQFEYLANGFEIAEGVALAPGNYSFNDVTINLSTANQRVVSVNAEAQLGQFWSGTRRRTELRATVRPSGSVNLSALVERQDVSLPEGRFDTTLMRVNGNWAPTPFVSLTNSLQYDDVSGGMGLNTHLRWIVRPGSEFYFVYAHNWLDDNGRFITMSHGATTKLNYTHRF